MKTYIVYHANCSDGFCSAWIVNYFLKQRAKLQKAESHEEPIFIAQHPQEAIPAFDDGSQVLYLDLCPTPEIMSYSKRLNSLAIIDHHETARQSATFIGQFFNGGKCAIVFDTTRSAAMLTWQYFLGGDPNGVTSYVQDRDLCKWGLPHSREINAALRSYRMSFEVWDKWWSFHKDDMPGKFAFEGEAILRSQQNIIDGLVKRAEKVDVGGYTVKAVNATCFVSEIGEQLAEQGVFGATFFVLANGDEVWSLRSKGDFNVGELARKLGGGGHKNAAGFTKKKGSHHVCGT